MVPIEIDLTTLMLSVSPSCCLYMFYPDTLTVIVEIISGSISDQFKVNLTQNSSFIGYLDLFIIIINQGGGAYRRLWKGQLSHE